MYIRYVIFYLKILLSREYNLSLVIPTVGKHTYLKSKPVWNPSCFNPPTKENSLNAAFLNFLPKI